MEHNEGHEFLSKYPYMLENNLFRINEELHNIPRRTYSFSLESPSCSTLASDQADTPPQLTRPAEVTKVITTPGLSVADASILAQLLQVETIDLTDSLNLCGHGTETHKQLKVRLEDKERLERRKGDIESVWSDKTYIFAESGFGSFFDYHNKLMISQEFIEDTSEIVDRLKEQLLTELTPRQLVDDEHLSPNLLMLLAGSVGEVSKYQQIQVIDEFDLERQKLSTAARDLAAKTGALKQRMESDVAYEMSECEEFVHIFKRRVWSRRFLSI